MFGLKSKKEVRKKLETEVQNYTEDDLLGLFEPAVTGELDDAGSGGLRDFWATIMDYGIESSQFDAVKEVDGVSVPFIRYSLQLKLSLRLDPNEEGKAVTQYEWFPLPTDPETGAPKMRDNKPVRPHKNSKWGRQELSLKAIGVPWEGRLTGLLGLHAHFIYQYFGKRTTTGDEDKTDKYATKGRFVREWDYYDNLVRQARGLEEVQLTSAQIAPPEGVNLAASAGVNPEHEAMKLLIGKGIIAYVGDVQRNHPSLVKFVGKPIVDEWEKMGYVVRETSATGVVYKEGPEFPA